MGSLGHRSLLMGVLAGPHSDIVVVAGLAMPAGSLGNMVIPDLDVQVLPVLSASLA